MEYTLFIFVIFKTFISTDGSIFDNSEINLNELDGDGNPGELLFLTPYVKSGNIDEGRKKARVPLTDRLGIESYAGYFTVNEAYNSNQFLWYFPAMSSNKEAPIVLWLQGGPGVALMFGLFLEHGPITVYKDKLIRRKYNWALNHHLVYIDSPVGTGFSFTNDSKGYCTDQTQVGKQLHTTLLQFFQLFPELQTNKFFVTGESYAGKYVPALAYTIHKMNPIAKIKINLKGIAIGNGLSDPEHQVMHGKFFYQIGLIDWNQAKVFEEYENKTIDLIKQKDYGKAYDTLNILMNQGLNDDGKSIFTKMTGYHYYLNYLYTDYCLDNYSPLIQKSDFRKAIHVGNQTYDDGLDVERHLKLDVMKSVAPWISELLEHYHVLIYNGHLDVTVVYPMVINYLRHLKFSGAKEYETAKRRIWQVDGEVAGYVKRAGKLVEIMMRNVGHLVPRNKPQWALDLLTSFTQNKTFIESSNLVKLLNTC